MTHSDKTRLAAVAAALTRVLEDLGDKGFDAVRFEVDSDRYRDLPQTTWLELEADMLVEPKHTIGNPGYRLTGAGWIAAQKVAGAYDTPAQRNDAVKLRTALKDVVNGRSLNGALTDLYGLQAATGLNMNWIFNALKSRLLQHLWPAEHLDVTIEYGGRSIRVPARFGANRLFGEAGPFPDP